MTRVRFERNPGFETELKAEPSSVAFMRETTQAVAEEATRLAPRHTSDYAHSIHAGGYTVYTEDPAGHLVEWGSKNNPAYAPLRRGVIAAGLRLKPDPKK